MERRDGAIPFNYASATGITITNPHRPGPRALTFEATREVFALIESDGQRDRPGPLTRKSHIDLAEVLLVQLAAGGLRVSEATAITVDDVAWDATPPTLRIHQADVYREPKGPKVDGKYEIAGQYLVQPHTKKAKIHVVPIPQFLLNLLTERAKTSSESGLLFHSQGRPLNTNNLRRTFRASLEGSEFEGWCSTHTTRRTIATDLAHDVRFGKDIAQQVMVHSHLATTEGS